MKKIPGTLWITALVLFVLAFFAADIPFYVFQAPLERASLHSSYDGLPLTFSYEGDNLTLHGASSDVTVYGLTSEGIARIPDGESSSFPESSLGTLAAVRAGYSQDTDGDGIEEIITEAAKTDMEFTQEHVSGGNAFLDERIPFEVSMTDRSTFHFTLHCLPLADTSITAILPDQREISLTTDKNGSSGLLKLNEFRQGVTFVYRPDTSHTFRFFYLWEDNTVFSLRWMQAMMPFTMILCITLLAILLDVFLRKRLYVRNSYPEAQVKVSHFGESKPHLHFGFEMIRWIVMLASFILLIWGGRILGSTFSSFRLPILACPYNMDQGAGAGCYLFSHVEELFASDVKEILWFAGSFAVCAFLFGRLLCGFVCPLGFVQDVMHELRQQFHTEGVALNEKLYASLRFIKWIMLLLFLGIGLIGGNFCDFCPAITLSPALAGFKTSVYFSGFMMTAVLVSGFFKRRCFCNICPMGYLLGLPHKISLVRLKKDAIACTECGACYEVCPMGIKSIFTIREGKNEQAIDVTTADCILCGACIRCCPEDHALYMTVCGKEIYTASRMRFLENNTAASSKA
ncbi:MAG: 4Fe-4S dicluster domain-containing protein [Blautia sp.]|nr:4Fe-4S dicluster domain-containing protein [Blautia sp.]